MVSASALRAKLVGLMVDKVEVSDGNQFAGCDTVEEVIEAMVKEIVTRTRGRADIENTGHDGVDLVLWMSVWYQLHAGRHFKRPDSDPFLS